jgi:hypothetical protein
MSAAGRRAPDHVAAYARGHWSVENKVHLRPQPGAELAYLQLPQLLRGNLDGGLPGAAAGAF